MPLIHEVLKQYWGYDIFRPLQEDIIKAVLEKKDVLALMPTGGGKSICFQVPTMAMEGLCIVITPLIALMQDQVKNLRKKNIKAVAIHAGMSYKEIDITLDACIYSDVKFLYLSPERLKSDIVLKRAKQMKVCLLAVDEAHCISQWGYDFRPAYIEIANFRTQLPNVPVIALTATATPQVAKDIQEKLMFKKAVCFQKSFARANLSYSCFCEEDKERKLLQILRSVPGTSVVYVRNRSRTKQIADMLLKNKISAHYYHAGLSAMERSRRQEDWIKNKTRVMVATNAFGMGIDKPDVRTVIHMDLPDSPEAYYQEAGRAGRDEKKAYAVLLYNANDLHTLEKKGLLAYPDITFIRKVYQCLANYYKLAEGSAEGFSFDFQEDHFTQTYRLPKTETYYALKRLESEGFILLNDSYHHPSRVHIKMNFEDLYKLQLENEDHDIFFKGLLRMYGGHLFNEFVPISENRLSNMLNLTEKEVIKKLSFYASSGIIFYEARKDTPQIVFTTQRYDASKLPINIKKMQTLKARDMERIQAMIAYATDKKHCRTKILLEYFGEHKKENCGVCDTCLQQRRRMYQHADFRQTQKKVKAVLSTGPHGLDELLEKLNIKKDTTTIHYIQYMLESGELMLDLKGKIHINPLEYLA